MTPNRNFRIPSELDKTLLIHADTIKDSLTAALNDVLGMLHHVRPLSFTPIMYTSDRYLFEGGNIGFVIELDKSVLVYLREKSTGCWSMQKSWARADFLNSFVLVDGYLRQKSELEIIPQSAIYFSGI